MLAELDALAKEFDALDQELTPLFTTWAERNGITQQHVERAFEELIEHQNSSQPNAAPNGGAAAPRGNSGATEGPPSVS